MFRCTFSDDGIGIPSGKSQELFNVYARGHANCRVTGYGLGLYMKVSELSTRVAILNNIEDILNHPIGELGVSAESVRPNSQ